MDYNKPLILIELNEVNFDIVSKYIAKGYKLPTLQKLLSQGLTTTVSEKEYELLEPWIQWPSVHTGMQYKEHQIFRLGDMVSASHEQIFEKVEALGLKVGAISPMNAINRLKNPSYFVPDPWTSTDAAGSWLLKQVSKAIAQAVNDNANEKLTFTSKISLLLGLCVYSRPKNWLKYIAYAITSRKYKWRKALFLDLFLNDLHFKQFNYHRPSFSTLFLNSCAHVQHHYFHNSKAIGLPENPNWIAPSGSDPVLEALQLYDSIISDYIMSNNYRIMIATGLSQIPFEDKVFYYRLRSHQNFLMQLGLKDFEVHPRMTRDFLITFGDKTRAIEAEQKLKGILVNGVTEMFGVIDNRGESLFVTLTYPKEINAEDFVFLNGNKQKLVDLCAFVAIKNGHHCSEGYVYCSVPSDISAGMHVADLNRTLMNLLIGSFSV